MITLPFLPFPASLSFQSNSMNSLHGYYLVRSDESLYLRVNFDGDYFEKAAAGSSDLPPLPRVVGWEMNERFVCKTYHFPFKLNFFVALVLMANLLYLLRIRGKPGPRVADLSALLDSSSLMAQVLFGVWVMG
jgi:hypothetical protein